MIDFEKIFSNRSNEYHKILPSINLKDLKEAYNQVTIQQFRSRQTGASRRDINVWKTEGLLPDTTDESGWNQFSIVESVWLRFISRLKKYGFNNDTIVQLKDYFFTNNPIELKKHFLGIKESKLIPDDLELFFSYLIDLIDSSPEAQLEKELKEIKFSIFGLLVMTIIKFHWSFVIAITDDKYAIIDTTSPGKRNQNFAVSEFITGLGNQTSLLISLKEFCTGFFENESVVLESENFFGLMNKDEQMVINQIRTGKYKMVTVKLTDGGISHIKFTKVASENEEMIRKLSRLFKTNDFKDIELITRNGEIINYQETDIVKIIK
ncbi:MAG: MerR family transcriptional regulator [Sediminibacterium sp.]|nr:MerR family transcriptional regulator [Sediminibacterium sp.]